MKRIAAEIMAGLGLLLLLADCVVAFAMPVPIWPLGIVVVGVACALIFVAAILFDGR